VPSTMRLLFIHLGDAKHLEGILRVRPTSLRLIRVLLQS
jgi:hypothetical protein